MWDNSRFNSNRDVLLNKINQNLQNRFSTVQDRMKENERRCRDFAAAYTIHREILARGLNYNILQAVHNSSGQAVALKVFRRDKMNKTEQILLRFQLETIQKLEHPNIMQTNEVFETEHVTIVVMDLMVMDLRQALVMSQNKNGLTESQSKEIFYQMLKAVQECHQNCIMHRNINSSNFLIDFDSRMNHKIKVKLNAFGSAASFKKKKFYSEKVGSVNYMAPEIIKGEKYNAKVDSWALGIVLFELLTGQLPYQALTSQRTEELIVKNRLNLYILGEAPYSLTQNAKDLLGCLLKKDPSARYSVEQALQHPWFVDLTKNADPQRLFTSDLTASSTATKAKDFK